MTTKTGLTKTEWVLALIVGVLTGLVLAGCENYVRITAPDATINITGVNRPLPSPAVPTPSDNSQLPTPNPDATEPGSTDLMDPPSDGDVPFNEDPPDTPDTCERNGRGGGTGAPGNGKGRGDEHGKACR